ncbi:hypothetical protein ACHAXS_000556 [Conticribra weissflogii]
MCSRPASSFLQIIALFVYTSKPPPLFIDKFQYVCQMLEVFNKHCKDNNCIINEYHFIPSGNQGKPTMWQINLEEGKDCTSDDNLLCYRV